MGERHGALGKESFVSILPKRQVGSEIAVGPLIDHTEYLRSANSGSHNERFKSNQIEDFDAPGGGHEILTVPKSSYVEAPDSMHMLLVATGRDRRGRGEAIPTFVDFTPEQGKMHFEILGKLAHTLTERYGNRWFMGTSISPKEWRRQAVQSVKTIHTHIVGFGSEEFIPFAELDPKERADRRRMLADSVTPLGIDLLRDLVFTQEFWDDPEIQEIVSEKDVTLEEEYPKGYTIALSGGVKVLEDPRVFALTKKIDATIEREYNKLSDVFTVRGEKDLLDRPVLRPEHERNRRLITFSNARRLSHTTHERLWALSKHIRSAVEEIGQAGGDVKEQIIRANTRLFLRGRAYNHLLFPTQNGSGRIMLSIVPRALSGGSPLDAFGIYKDQYLTDPKIVDAITQRHVNVAHEIVADSFKKPQEEPEEVA